MYLWYLFFNIIHIKCFNFHLFPINSFEYDIVRQALMKNQFLYAAVFRAEEEDFLTLLASDRPNKIRLHQAVVTGLKIVILSQAGKSPCLFELIDNKYITL